MLDFNDVDVHFDIDVALSALDAVLGVLDYVEVGVVAVDDGHLSGHLEALGVQC